MGTCNKWHRVGSRSYRQINEDIETDVRLQNKGQQKEEDAS